MPDANVRLWAVTCGVPGPGPGYGSGLSLGAEPGLLPET